MFCFYIAETFKHGANVAPFKPMAIPDDLAATIASARMKVGTLLSVIMVMVPGSGG